ncbi:protein FAM114A2-like [Vespa mandarinia]|uniref:protein FAM114A2-like n=1 Tax=Vespa mandarinia TaxID=7446 RepID=UPI001620F349|nr:protein FAM114A2-like [Vespa mandarinia]XP_035726441.1 protein FAM114A2-like [Vespa mandarinia]
MATSESDDFESADEELAHNVTSKTNVEDTRWSGMQSVVDSESDDDTECIPQLPRKNILIYENPRFRSFRGEVASDEEKLITLKDISTKECNDEESKVSTEKIQEIVPSTDTATETTIVKDNTLQTSTMNQENSTEVISKSITAIGTKEERLIRPKKSSDGSRKLGARKLGTKIEKESDITSNTIDNVKENISTKNVISKESTMEIDVVPDISSNADLSEVDMPEELKSNKKFKEIFKPQGWEKIGNNIELDEDLTEQKIQPVLDRLSIDDKDTENSLWANWGSWGVSSLINTATAGVSTLTTHVSQGLSLLEETINLPDNSQLQMIQDTTQEEEVIIPEKELTENVSSLSQGSFGLSSFLLGVSSITKLVESTGSKVMSGGLDTLEAIGKKTMEVLQEGDPGLKKKRAFFMPEENKPNLSQILREAKDKAESEEKTIEEKQLARKIHFESLFDDYQGLVHLEALEMLSKQCNIKIQGCLINLDAEDLISLQETLEEVKELCDLDDEENKSENKRDLKSRLADACQELEIIITYEKLEDIWKEVRSSSFVTSPMSHTNLEIFQCAISTIAKFTAVSMERFHKTAELLLIKERRSTASEAEALVRLTHILTDEISLLATHFSDVLKEFIKMSNSADDINANITTVFFEAENASSYIQDAFKLLIPILQVGAL